MGFFVCENAYLHSMNSEVFIGGDLGLKNGFPPMWDQSFGGKYGGKIGKTLRDFKIPAMDKVLWLDFIPISTNLEMRNQKSKEKKTRILFQRLRGTRSGASHADVVRI